MIRNVVSKNFLKCILIPFPQKKSRLHLALIYTQLGKEYHGTKRGRFTLDNDWKKINITPNRESKISKGMSKNALKNSKELQGTPRISEEL